MQLTKQQVLHIAKLSRLHLNEEEVISMQEDLWNILDYVEQLSEVDTSWIDTTGVGYSHALPLREDVVDEKIMIKKELLKSTPQEVIGDQIAIPNIMK